jgi:TolA-binding protein
VIVIVNLGERASVPAAPELAISEEPSLVIALRSRVEPAPLQRVRDRAEIVASNADFARERMAEQDIVTLHDGELAIDSRGREPVTIVSGDTRVAVTSSRAVVVARAGVIVTARVFAGSAQVTAAGKRVVIDAGDVWRREAPIERTDNGPTTSLAAFRQGWEALRDKRYAEAIAAFDRATDPVVAEDAAFWAAIASERAGYRDDAATRLRAFIARFPASLRIETAHAALDRVTR